MDHTRVEFSARSVITNDSSLDIDEVGIPDVIAMTLTKPVRVNQHNLAEMQRRVRLGPRHLHGAKTLTYPSGKMVTLEYSKQRQTLDVYPGCIVERHLKNGDYVLLNRNPTLSKKSLQAHRVKIMKDKTFRLSIFLTGPYNADFDGDEVGKLAFILCAYSSCAKTNGCGGQKSDLLDYMYPIR